MLYIFVYICICILSRKPIVLTLKMAHRIIFYSHKWIKFQDIGRPSRVQFFKYDIAVIYSFYIFNQEMVITIFLCCFSALLFPIVRRHLISTYILHVGQLDTHFLSWWMKSHSSLSIHYISQTTSKKKSCKFLYISHQTAVQTYASE